MRAYGTIVGGSWAVHPGVFCMGSRWINARVIEGNRFMIVKKPKFFDLCKTGTSDETVNAYRCYCTGKYNTLYISTISEEEISYFGNALFNNY